MKPANDTAPAPEASSVPPMDPVPPGLVEVLARILARDLQRNPPTSRRRAA